MLIAIEGIDGSGKTTQVNLLGEAFKKVERMPVISKEPTDGVYGRQLRASAFTGRLSPQDELDLFILDRKEHVEKLITPSLEASKIVILDRYYFSTIAYQSARGLPASEIRLINEAFAPRPDLLFILDVPIDESLRRIGVRDGQGNGFEDRENLEKCRDVFMTITGDFVHHINAERPKDVVHATIMNIVERHPKIRELGNQRYL